MFFSVQDVMMIVGGKTEASYKNTAGYKKTMLPNGETCTHDIPNFTQVPLEGFGMASRKNRYVYLCGGIKRSPTPSKYK